MKKVIVYAIVVFESFGDYRYVNDDCTEGYFVFKTLKEAREFLPEIREHDEPKAVIMKETRELIAD